MIGLISMSEERVENMTADARRREAARIAANRLGDEWLNAQELSDVVLQPGQETSDPVQRTAFYERYGLIPIEVRIGTHSRFTVIATVSDVQATGMLGLVEAVAGALGDETLRDFAHNFNARSQTVTELPARLSLAD